MSIKLLLRAGIKVKDWKIRKLLSLRKDRKYSPIWGMISPRYWNIFSLGTMIRGDWSIRLNGKSNRKSVKTKMHK